MRPWGEDAASLRRAGADLDELRRLERSLEDDLGGLSRAGAVDAHVHLGRDRDGHRLDDAGLLADLDRWGLRAAVCFPADEPGVEGDFAAANDAVLAAARRAPGRIIPFCRVDPGHPRARDELARAAAAGARGLKLHPVAQRFRPEAPEAAALVRDAAALGWPVTIHAGFGARPLAGPIGALLEAAPGARLILAHGGRGDARAIAARLADWPGVMLDTSLAAMADLVRLPPDRLVFGSDRPYGEHGTALRLVALAARAAGWSPADCDGVMGGNLRAWLP
ncbi:amidohydrolase family protein [Miltoncostaea marina]|uniref:amidohydrolase family protein n=1 Tax=Miltoncostaea marina TaxID=2843215 RepID=UPI001C3D0E3D|nr:amidohydrolase family protein [Miltoncostaea marina]